MKRPPIASGRGIMVLDRPALPGRGWKSDPNAVPAVDGDDSELYTPWFLKHQSGGTPLRRRAFKGILCRGI